MVVILLLVGCPAVVDTELGIAPGENPPVTNGSNPSSNITYEGNQKVTSLEEGFGVYGSKIEFNGIYPGWSGTVPLSIVNGKDRDRLFVISAVSPANPKEGYEAFPKQYLYWITISQPSVTVLKGGSFQVPITLTMPADADYKDKKTEVRILIEDTTQTGLVQIAVESRWFIITAD